MPENAQPTLSTLAEDVAAAVRRNAEVLSASRDPAHIVAANDALGAASQAYAIAVSEVAGWGNPFVAPPEDEPEADDAEQDGDIRVHLSYTLRINSKEDLAALLQDRGLTPEPLAGPHDTDDGSGTVQALLEADGWRPEDYADAGITVIQAEWSIET